MSLEEKKVLASVDWGTYGVYVLYAHVGHCTDARAVLTMDGNQDTEYDKIPNSLLIKRETGEVIAYGDSARRMYTDCQQDAKEEPSEETERALDELNEMALFENFKLHLVEQKENDFDRHLLVPSADPNFSFELCGLVEKCLRVIKRNTIEYYATVEGRAMSALLNTESEILWIVSVPVTWSDLAKETMVQCCREAGIDSDNVLIVSEPEAAASFLLWDTDEGRALSPGDQYMCIDLGGGTFDIVCHKVLHDKSVVEVHREEGGLAGGKHVDDKLFTLLGHVFSEECVQQFIEESPADYVAQRIAFQRLRENLREDVGTLNLEIETSLYEMAADDHNLTIERIEENCANFRPDGFHNEPLVSFKRVERGRFTNYNLRMNKIAWDWLFEDVLAEVKACMKRVLTHRDCDDVKTVFAVGGFSKSEIVQAELRKLLYDDEALRDREMTWKRPPRPELAVARGSLWFADKHTIHGRRMKYSYGLATERPYMRGDPKDKRKADASYPRGYKTIDCFDGLWFRDEPYELGDDRFKRMREYQLLPGQKDVSIEIFRSTDDLVKFVTEDSCARPPLRYHYEVPPQHVSVREQRLMMEFSMKDRQVQLRVCLKSDDNPQTEWRRIRMQFPAEWSERPVDPNRS